MSDVAGGTRESRLCFLVLGCGSIGKRHIGNLMALDAGRILAFDVQVSRRDEVRRQFGVEGISALEEAWGYQPDVALITAPTTAHTDLALQAAEWGCHLFIEKPLSDRLDGTESLLEIARKRSLVTLVGCNMRFHPGLIRVKRLLDEGAVDRVVAVRAEVGQYLPDWHPWEDYRQLYSARRNLGGGVILDAIHEIDYLRWMFGEVETVACLAGKLSSLQIETEDTAAILLRFANGTIGEIHLDYVQRAYSRTCQVIGEGGTILWDYTTGVRWYSAADRKWRELPNPPDWKPNDMYLDEMRHFLRCLAGKERPAQDLFAAVGALEVAMAARASSQNGRFVRPRS